MILSAGLGQVHINFTKVSFKFLTTFTILYYFYPMKIRQILLFPLALTYGLIIRIRNLLFAVGVFRRHAFDIPVIVIGNLAVGGTGKTPMTEYLLDLLGKKNKLAVLSRGYKRKTRGFKEADIHSTAAEIGDESLQVKRKYPQMVIAVDEDRVHGLNELLRLYPDLDAVVLDDAFQHRRLKPGFSIVITNYNNLYTSDYLLPAGMLREHTINAKKADVIVVHKTPRIFSPIERKAILNELKPEPLQKIFFSYIDYGALVPLFSNASSPVNVTAKYAILVTGIANPDPAIEFLKRKYQSVELISYPDHYHYTSRDMEQIGIRFHDIYGRNKIIIITEKDAVKFTPEITESIKDLPVYILPVKLRFHGNDSTGFESTVIQYFSLNRRKDGLR